MYPNINLYHISLIEFTFIFSSCIHFYFRIVSNNIVNIHSHRKSDPSIITLRSFQIICFWILLVAGLGISLYVNRTRSKRLQQEVAGLRQRMEEIDNKAEAARTRATEAAQSARQAAIAKDQADDKRVAAEAEAKQASQKADEAQQRADAAEKEAKRIRQEREDELNRLQEALQKIAETRRTAMGLVMNLDSNSIQFEFNKAVLQSMNRELLSRIAGILLTSKGYSITVHGHTDDVGSDAYNQELSERRAQAVRDYLVDAGIGAAIISTKGYGKSKPLVAAKTPQARAKNRRVEVEIVDTILNFNPPK